MCLVWRLHEGRGIVILEAKTLKKWKDDIKVDLKLKRQVFCDVAWCQVRSYRCFGWLHSLQLQDQAVRYEETAISRHVEKCTKWESVTSQKSWILVIRSDHILLDWGIYWICHSFDVMGKVPGSNLAGTPPVLNEVLRACLQMLG